MAEKLQSDHQLVASFFDAQFYLQTNPDVAAAGLNPLLHFLKYGWREGRNPNATFNMAHYLRAYPAVAAGGIIRLLSHALKDHADGRQPRRPLDAERSLIERSRAPTFPSRNPPVVPLLERATLSRKLAAAARDAMLVVSFSHDDYLRIVGGVQKVMREERLAFEELGYSYLHISPAVALPTLSNVAEDESTHFSLRLGVDHLGWTSAGDLVAVFEEMRRSNVSLLLVVHHFLGHEPETLARIALLTELPVIVWIHDYFTLCPNYNLLRNDVRFCGAPPPESTACGICVYGEERLLVRKRIHAFFEKTRPWVLAPSEAALSLWLEREGFPCLGTSAWQLARLILDSDVVNRTPDLSRPLRIAHLGARNHAKGWTTFERLVSRFSKDSGYIFLQLGYISGAALPRVVRQVPVMVTEDAPDAMIEAIAENGIDVVVAWSSWAETFCYAAHEAIAGGALVLTHQGAGNIPALIANQAPEQGLVLADEGALHSLFENGGLRRALCDAKLRRGVLVPEGGTAGWLLQSVEGQRIWRDVARRRSAFTFASTPNEEGARV